MDVSVRLAEHEDLAALCDLVEQYWRFERIDGFDKGRIQGLLGSLLAHPHHGHAWVASDGTSLVGYLLMVHVFSLENGGPTAEIDEFFVIPAARGRGVGVRLLEVAEASLRHAGCRSVALQLGKANEAGRAFYTRQGYVSRSGYDLLEKSL